jgi:hypothetical protein
VSFSKDAGCETAIAGKPAPTVVCGEAKIGGVNELFKYSPIALHLSRPFSTIAPLAVTAGTHVSIASKSISVIHSLSDRF